MYILNLAEDNRILSAGIVLKEPTKHPSEIVVDALPDISDDKWIMDYIYNPETSEYIYSPVPRLEELVSEPTTDDILNVLLGVEG